MAILDECKAALRTTTTNTQLVGRINHLIETVKTDLKDGGVHKSWLSDEPDDPVIIETIICYVCCQYFNDLSPADSDKWLSAYNAHRAKIHGRSKYEKERSVQ